MTQRLVYGYHTDGPQRFSAAFAAGERAAPFMVWTARRPAVTWASTLLLFSVLDPGSPQTCLVFLPGRPNWAAAMCSMLSQTQCICDFSSGGYPRIFHFYQESCGTSMIWVTGRKQGQSCVTYAHTHTQTLMFQEKDILVSKSTLLKFRLDRTKPLWLCHDHERVKNIVFPS